jgi:hypothetical protein
MLSNVAARTSAAQVCPGTVIPSRSASRVAAVVVERHGHVQRVPGGDDVGDARVERNPVQRGVRLDEPPVLLRGKLGKYLFPRRDQVIQPRR